MKWIEIIVNIKKEYADMVSDIFYRFNVGGIQVDDGIEIPDDNLYWDYIDESDLNSDNISKVSAYFSEEDNDINSIINIIKEELDNLSKEIDLGEFSIDTKEHLQEDWETSWKQYFKPIKVTENIVVKPQWEEYTKNDGEIVINIDPGMAFGTGGHETTSMCIKALEENIDSAKDVLDIGTGSGILAIASILLGANAVTGVDLDPVAVKVAKENAELNNVSDKINILHGDLISVVNGKFDIIVANIIADAILMLLDMEIEKLFKKNSKFICSGIILSKEKDILDKLKEKNFKVLNIDRLGEWVCITSEIQNG